MNLTRDRVRSIGWVAVLTTCLAVTLGLTFRVNAVKSEVRLLDRRIVALRREKLFLETEFETRASQQQLRSLNEIEFGYDAPRAEQYIEGERQLAALGMPRPPDAPAPIRAASADAGGMPSALAGFPAMLSPLTGRPMTQAGNPVATVARADLRANLGERLGQITPRDRAPAGDTLDGSGRE